MPDQMEDEKLTRLVCAALFDDCFVNKATLERTRHLLGKLRAAGYRIVKPEDDWADMSAYEASEDDFGADRIAHSTGDRRFVIETILHDSKDGHEIMETITVTVSRESLLAELKEMEG